MAVYRELDEILRDANTPIEAESSPKKDCFPFGGLLPKELYYLVAKGEKIKLGKEVKDGSSEISKSESFHTRKGKGDT